MRGERTSPTTSATAPVGSSPHARGTLKPMESTEPHTRFIPACAGNAMERLGARASNTVHPRMRGERPLTFSHVSDLSGSSPHARGTPILLNTPILNRRFIPACAGNALINPFQGRGETGSSPHARGTPTFYRLYTVKSRFIPACAGNARTVAVSALPSTVHPRMRGERGGCLSHNHLHTGSSPHARGTRAWASFIIVMGRFIPACAGNARVRSIMSPNAAVHPRMRGERWAGHGASVVNGGSSPHARGTQDGSPAS